MSPAPLALHYCVEKPDVKGKSIVVDKQNVIGRYNKFRLHLRSAEFPERSEGKFAKGAG